MFVENDARGSIWRKWDLHIHTPASYVWKGPRFNGTAANDDPILATMVEAMNNADAVAFCFMDYWHLDGWFALQQYIAKNPDHLKKKVFPGIELRIDAPADYKLNTHFLFDDTLSKQQLTDFISTLQLSGIINRSPSSESFIQLAQSYSNDKLHHYGCKPEDRDDEAKMRELGMKTAKITRESWHRAKNSLSDRVLIIQPFDTNDGLVKLNWEDHPSEDTEIMRSADFFEARGLNNIRLLVGAGHPTREDVTENFKHVLEGKWRPVVSGSDAHKFEDYGVFPAGKTCWLKADISFAGLKQCMVDPIGRVFIGSEPHKKKHQANNKTKYIKSIAIAKNDGSPLNEHWFDSSIYLNYGMVSIIGNKGSGKSALADIIALAGNSHCPKFEFLTKGRFRKASENKSEHFSATITWSDGEAYTVPLENDSNKDYPERVRYLPQQYLEDLCTEVGSHGANCFESELKKVIFSHVPTHERLEFGSLDQLIHYQTEQIDHHIQTLRSELSSVNREIIEIEEAITAESLTAINSQIELKRKELLAIDQNPPAPVPQPSTQTGEPARIAQQISIIRQELDKNENNIEQDNIRRIRNTAAIIASQRLAHAIQNIQLDLVQAIENLEEDINTAGVENKNLISFNVNAEPIKKRQDQLFSEAEDLNASILIFEEKSYDYKIILEQLQEQASEPERLYQIYLQNLKEWESRRSRVVGSKDTFGSLNYLLSQQNYLINEAPIILTRLEIRRDHISEKIYNQIQRQIDIYKLMYKPIESAASSHKFVLDNIKIGFNAVIEAGSFTGHLLSMINQGRRGTFYGSADGADAARQLINQANFTSWMGLKLFLNSVLSSLKNDKRTNRNESISIKSQLKDQFTINEVYDYVFGLGYLTPRLTLQLGGKEISELSPGERGILLLVFYLLLDKEEIPLIIDQPEHNLDNGSVFNLLEPCIRHARHNRQIILVTHNPNVAIVCDAEQIIFAKIDKQNGNKVTYKSGAIENPQTNLEVVNVLEGTWPAFRMRDSSYQRV